MQRLVDKIKSEGRYLGNSVVKVDSFLNHQVDSELMAEIGKELFRRLNDPTQPITKVVTAEVSGIAPAFATAMAGGCKMIYARKSLSKTMTDRYYHANAISRTRGNDVTFYVNSNFLSADDNVLIIEDFLATGSSISALVDIVTQSGASLCGIGTVIEKPAEKGREVIAKHTHDDCLVVSLASIRIENNELVVESGNVQ
ncbi:MAG: xanthine phosphoribosyltransferase [Gammaproteobacteria bacterium]|nr:xanthine phosphoribosyltransferase [Gammaproteobacteria bacterium]